MSNYSSWVLVGGAQIFLGGAQTPAGAVSCWRVGRIVGLSSSLSFFSCQSCPGQNAALVISTSSPPPSDWNCSSIQSLSSSKRFRQWSTIGITTLFYNKSSLPDQNNYACLDPRSVQSGRPPWDSTSPTSFESPPFLLSSSRLTSSGCRWSSGWQGVLNLFHSSILSIIYPYSIRNLVHSKPGDSPTPKVAGAIQKLRRLCSK